MALSGFKRDITPDTIEKIDLISQIIQQRNYFENLSAYQGEIATLYEAAGIVAVGPQRKTKLKRTSREMKEISISTEALQAKRLTAIDISHLSLPEIQAIHYGFSNQGLLSNLNTEASSDPKTISNQTVLAICSFLKEQINNLTLNEEFKNQLLNWDEKKEITPEMRYIAGIIFSCTRGYDPDIEKIFSKSEEGTKLQGKAIEIAEKQHLINTLTLNGKSQISANEYLSAVNERLSSMQASNESEAHKKLKSAMESNKSIVPALTAEIREHEKKFFDFKKKLQESVPVQWKEYFNLESDITVTKSDPKTKAMLNLRNDLIDVRNKIKKGEILYEDGISKLKTPIEAVKNASVKKSIWKSDTAQGLTQFMEVYYPQASPSFRKKSEKK